MNLRREEFCRMVLSVHCFTYRDKWICAERGTWDTEHRVEINLRGKLHPWTPSPIAPLVRKLVLEQIHPVFSMSRNGQRVAGSVTRENRGPRYVQLESCALLSMDNRCDVIRLMILSAKIVPDRIESYKRNDQRKWQE